MKHLFYVLIIVLLSSGCKGPLSAPGSSDSKKMVHNAVVKEVIHAGGYTYLNVTEKRKQIWLAVPGMEAVQGDKLSYSGGLEMTDFVSKELRRTFPSILFLESVTMASDANAKKGMNNITNGSMIKTEKINTSIEPGIGCISIEKLLENKTEYSGKTVKVRGKISKFNPEIMGKNWVHIQDGTEFNGGFDLTITTDSQHSVGDTVTFEGKITLNKDFGYGYTYAVIMEGGKQVK